MSIDRDHWQAVGQPVTLMTIGVKQVVQKEPSLLDLLDLHWHTECESLAKTATSVKSSLVSWTQCYRTEPAFLYLHTTRPEYFKYYKPKSLRVHPTQEY